MIKVVFIFAISLCYANAIVIDENSGPRGVNRISNGNLAVENQFPYVVSIQQSSAANPDTTATRGHRCGGVLITFTHVLTSANCFFVESAGTQVQLAAVNLRVFAGSTSLQNDTSADRVRTVTNITIHDGFIQAPSKFNDIAIVTLSSPFPSSAVTPLPLPPATYDPPDFNVCTVAGWGAFASTNTPPAPMSELLRLADKYIYNQDRCSFLYSGDVNGPNIHPSMVCAGSFNQLAAGCNGDSGNALVCNNTLTGILIHYTDCQVASALPEVYTRVSNYTEWIRSITGASNMISPAIFMFVLAAIVQVISSHFVL